MPVTALPRYYGRSDSCSLQFFGSSFLHERWLVSDEQVSLIHEHDPPAIPSPAILRVSLVAFARYHSAQETSQDSLPGLEFAHL
jgi:hypothetical protein